MPEPMSRKGTSSVKVGFVGLGVMGTPMAMNLVKGGFDVLVFDLRAPALAAAADQGARTAADLGELVDHSDVVVTMLPDTPQVEEVLRAPDGILVRGRSGLVLLDMSTISPLATRGFAEELAAAGMILVDAPVSGGVQKAETGELSIMVGADDEAFGAVEPMLWALGAPTLMGGIGSGQAAKACNQVAITLTIQAACEAFALGSKLGLDLEKLRSVLASGSCASFVMDNLAPMMLAGDDRPGFRIALQVKDLKIATEAAMTTATALPGASTVLDLYLDAMADGQRDDGNQSLSRVYERRTAATIGRLPYETADASR